MRGEEAGRGFSLSLSLFPILSLSDGGEQGGDAEQQTGRPPVAWKLK